MVQHEFALFCKSLVQRGVVMAKQGAATAKQGEAVSGPAMVAGGVES